MSHCSSCYNKLGSKKPIICASCGGLLCKLCKTHSLPTVGINSNNKADKYVVCDKCYTQQTKKTSSNDKTQDFSLPSYLQLDPSKAREHSYYTYGKPEESQSGATTNNSEDFLPRYLQPEFQTQIEKNSTSGASRKRQALSKTNSGISLDTLEPRDQDIVDRLDALKGAPPGGREPQSEGELKNRLDKLRGFSVDNAYSEGKTDFPLRVTMRPSSGVAEDDLVAQITAENDFKSHLIRSYTMPDKEFEDRRKMFQQDPTLLDEIEMIDLMDDMQMDICSSSNNNNNDDDVKSKPNWYLPKGASPMGNFMSDHSDFNSSVEQLITQTMEEVKNDRLVEAVSAKVDFDLYNKLSILCPTVTPGQLRPLSPTRIQNSDTAGKNNVTSDKLEQCESMLQDEDSLMIMLAAIGYNDVNSPTQAIDTTARESLFANQDNN